MNLWPKIITIALMSWVVSFGVPNLAEAQTKPEGEMRFALYVTVAPAWLHREKLFRTILPHSGSCTRCMTPW